MNKITGKGDDRRMISESGSALDRLIREGATNIVRLDPERPCLLVLKED